MFSLTIIFYGFISLYLQLISTCAWCDFDVENWLLLAVNKILENIYSPQLSCPQLSTEKVIYPHIIRSPCTQCLRSRKFNKFWQWNDGPFLFKWNNYELSQDIELVADALKSPLIAELAYFLDSTIISRLSAPCLKHQTFCTWADLFQRFIELLNILVFSITDHLFISEPSVKISLIATLARLYWFNTHFYCFEWSSIYIYFIL